MERKEFILLILCQLVVDDKRSRKGLEKGQCSSAASRGGALTFSWLSTFFSCCAFARLVLACI